MRLLAADESEAASTAVIADHQPPVVAQLLMVRRDWSEHNAQQIRKNVTDVLNSSSQNVLSLDETNITTVASIVPAAGHAAVFEPARFHNLVQWLRDMELLTAEQTIDLKPSRFENRWTATIHPSEDVEDIEEQADQTWHLQMDVLPSRNPDIAARLGLQRTHSRPSPSSGPRLRGAALDIRKRVSFPVPKDRIVAMTWYAHPSDLGRAPTPEQRRLEPILVFRQAHPEPDGEATAQFELPEKIMELSAE